MISLSTKAHYKTQSSIWDVQIGKNLTDRVIAKYQKLGYYSNGIVKAEIKNEKSATQRKKKLAELFKGF